MDRNLESGRESRKQKVRGAWRARPYASFIVTGPERDFLSLATRVRSRKNGASQLELEHHYYTEQMALLGNILGFSAFGLAARLGQLGIQRRNPLESASIQYVVVL